MELSDKELVDYYQSAKRRREYEHSLTVSIPEYVVLVGGVLSLISLAMLVVAMLVAIMY